MIHLGDVIGVAVFGGMVGALVTATIFRDRRYDALVTFCREVVDKNEEQLRLLSEQVRLIVAQDDELKRLREKETP